MKFRLVLCLFALAMPMAMSAAEESAAPPAKRSWYDRILHPFGGPKDKAPTSKDTNFKRLELALQIEPNPPKLSESKLIKVTLTLANKTNKLVQLEFPTSQRIEVLIKSQEGKMVEQWVRLRAYLQLDNDEGVQAALAYLREHRNDSLRIYQAALVRVGDADAAAALLIGRLEDLSSRVEALESLQRYGEGATDDAGDESPGGLAARDDVRAVIERVGRIESYPYLRWSGWTGY